MIRLSVTLIVHNEEKNIVRCIESVRTVADEIVVVDSISTDRTAEICRSLGCRVFAREFDGYGTQKQFAVECSSNSWVLSIDADEVITEELKNEILEWKKTGGAQSFHGFRIPFSLYFMGKILQHGGVGKELHLRLFNRDHGGFTKVPVHEGIRVNGTVGTMRGRIVHYSYRDISHHLEKINFYTTRAAEGYVSRGKHFSRCWVPLKFPISFFTFYVIKGGFLDGYPGFMWSFLAAVYATLKIAKTIEITPNR